MSTGGKSYAVDDPEEVMRIVRETPWATFVSDTSRGLLMTQYPILLDRVDDDLVLYSHFCGPDVNDFEIGDHQMMVIIHGPNGYISPSWTPDSLPIPTWDFVTVQLKGVPQVVTEEENFKVLQRMVTQYEEPLPNPRVIEPNDEQTRKVALATTGIRMVVSKWSARAKLSQNKPSTVQQRIIQEMSTEGWYSNPRLGAEIKRVAAPLD